MLKIKKTISPVIQVGIWPQDDRLHIVWFDEQHQPQSLQLDTTQPLSIPKIISDQYPQNEAPLKFKFITAILPHQIWSKSVILPQQLNRQECEQQCRFILENELPVPFEDLWFDYCAIPLKQGLRLDVFAIMPQTATTYLNRLAPLSVDVLDNAAHCLLRAFAYLCPHLQPQSSLLLHQDEQLCLALQNKSHQLQLLQQSTQNLTALFTQYCDRYKETPEQIILYRVGQHTEKLPEDWEIIETDLSLIALGAALWQRDLEQDEI